MLIIAAIISPVPLVVIGITGITVATEVTIKLIVKFVLNSPPEQLVTITIAIAISAIT